jgi:hypothetical protein
VTIAVRKAVEFGLNLPGVPSFASYVLACCGRATEAVGLVWKAMTLSPTYPANYLGVLGNALRLAGGRDEAIYALLAYPARGLGFGLVDIVATHRGASGLLGHLMDQDPIPQRCRSNGG